VASRNRPLKVTQCAYRTRRSSRWRQDVATAVADAALAEPVNGTVEIAGPDAFHLDEIVDKVLQYDKVPRKVIVDPEARYFGVKLSDTSLIPGRSPHLGSTKFDWWLTHVPAPQKH
jgi:uncharacterized protein YbjT (DUF2867 family)